MTRPIDLSNPWEQLLVEFEFGPLDIADVRRHFRERYAPLTELPRDYLTPTSNDSEETK